MLEIIENQRRLAEAGRRLREDTLAVSADLLRSFESAHATMGRCVEWAADFERMMGDDVLTTEEVSCFGAMLGEIERTIAATRGDEAGTAALRRLDSAVERASALVLETTYVVEVDTSMFGDRVYNVPKRALVCLDEDQCSALVFEMSALMVDRSGGDDDEGFAATVRDAACLAGWVQDVVLPGVLRERMPELLVELRDRLHEIGLFLAAIRTARELDVFERVVAEARGALTSLVADQKGSGEPIRLTGWFLQKEEAAELQRFVSFLRG